MTAADYLELMPSESRVINSYGVKIRHRIYDSEELNPYRGQRSGLKALNRRWEVKYNPYDAGCVWVRNPENGSWIIAYWKQLQSSPQPFGDASWEYGRQIVAERGTSHPSQDTIKAAVDAILDLASPPAKPASRAKKNQRAAARNKAAITSQRARPMLDGANDPAQKPAAAIKTEEHSEVKSPQGPAQLAKIIPLKIYDAHKEAEKW
ncbi:Mu transposase C-terminal domain-containing protein [Paeniglutamicibacter sp. Y32M11]|uniref:Mu transposase C-terminal domain-containing protein n=1 Tax=Paeniglutamicibacter sp. Y32M11 TaxID=2853258 RepID=UPI001C5289DC|nr:Mu transposase C-terminal domain-containing protein [Paeniglutamicibacter sp. Y32M11]QXQ08764.1 Mu transposase C-terminal domain-containing protein [Paeniglutamicibacter sp. Y32M11]